jgi:hypothetical protein
MATLSKKITELKAQYPTLKTGDDVNGYTELSADEYESKIAEWANAELAQEEKIATDKDIADKVIADKLAAQAKLAALGLTADDLKALGL